MTTEWIITIVSLCLTALMSLSSIILPFIMNYKSNKLKSKEQAVNFLNQTIYELLNSYGEFRSNSAYTQHTLSAIYKVMTFCNTQAKLKLQELTEQITKLKISYKECDDLFFECISLLQNEFNLTKLLGKQSRQLKK